MSISTRTRLDDRFTLDARIGEGTFAEIYRATDTQTGAVVAVKTLRPEQAGNQQAIALFHQEGEIGSSLIHPNIVRVLSYGETSGTYFIVMELVSGISLRRRMRRAIPLSISESVRLIRAVLRGLEHIHDAGYVHRDIKPQNILLEADGTPKITDFGITLRTGGIRAPGDGTTLGTAAYIAPEQAAGWEIGPQADLYAVGVVLYEMLTGQVPFPGDDPIEVMHRHMFETPRDPRTLNAAVSSALSAVVLRVLAKEPEARFASAREMHDALAMLHFDELPGRAPVRAAAAAMRSANRRKPAPAAHGSFLTSFVGALMLAVLLLILVLALVSSGVGADGFLHSTSQPTQPAGVVIDQPATSMPQLHQQASVAQQPFLTPGPTIAEQPPVNNTVGVATAIATPTPTATQAATAASTPSPSPTQSATSTPQPSATSSATGTAQPTATPQTTATVAPEPQIAQAPVRTVSDEAPKEPVVNNDGNADHKPEKSQKKEPSDTGDQKKGNAQKNDASGSAGQPGNGDNSNQQNKQGPGTTQNPNSGPASNQSPSTSDANSNKKPTKDAEESDHHHKKKGKG
jgi:serine/threonine-protein kinase